MKQCLFEIVSNRRLAPNVFEMVLRGDCSAVAAPGQFVNLRLDGFYLRRPISVCNVDGDALTLIDFKTDRVDAATLRARYGRQLALYAEALARCFGKPVRQQLLYSLYLGQTVELTP